MGLGNNDFGAKGDSYNYKLRVLKLLSSILAALGGSSGSAVTIVDGGDAALGAKADAAAATDTGTFSLISLFKRLLQKLTTGIQLVAGSAIVGKFGIDQTAPGTTNGVVVNSGTITTVSTLTSGNVGGFTASVATTPTLSVGGAAATGDYVGTTTAPQSFASVVRTSGGTGIIKSISIVDKLTTAAVDIELWLYSDTFTAPTDNAAWTISDTDALKFLGVIKISGGDWVASAVNKAYSNDILGQVIKPAGTSLFYAIVARGTTPAWVTGDLQITIGILQD